MTGSSPCSLSALQASPGFTSLQRLQNREATYPGVTKPEYAASSGFLTLLTLCSSRNLPGRVSGQQRSWDSALRRVPLSWHGPHLPARPCPPGVSSRGRADYLPSATSPTFRALISTKVRCPPTDKRRLRPDPPLSFFSPPGVSLQTRQQRFLRCLLPRAFA
jgi:hypothetical protein